MAMWHTLLRFQKTRTIIQVGAYTGDDGLIAACRAYGHRLYMFEPNPARAAELMRKTAGAPSIEVLPMAVSNFNGTARFKIAAYDDCSSLQDFDAEANQTWVHEWHPYKRFEMVDELDVPVVRLDTFLALRGLTSVDLLEIDAQGEDLRVVESLGDRISDVKKIQIEVNIHDAPLYANAFGMAEAVAFFDARGFAQHVAWKQSLNREANVIFRNRRTHRFQIVPRAMGFAEQHLTAAYFTWLKLPRVAAVTWMMLRRKLTGQMGAPGARV
jgi:FkbM family methyltransferase